MGTSANILRRICASLIAATVLVGCHDTEQWDNDLYGNFDALWTIMDEHYCFFDEKDVDWNQIRTKYRAEIDPEWTSVELFDHCAAMLAELRDGHTNLMSWFDVSYYSKWWTDYPQNFNERLLLEHYLDFDYRTSGSMLYKMLADSTVAYVRYSSFTSCPSDGFIDYMMLSMKDAAGLIFDIRDNGGGNISYVEKLAGHFCNEDFIGGYICHKTGKGHDQFSEPYPVEVKPVYGVRWLKPVIILTNRSTFSAANNFVGVMKQLPHVAIVGARTGGGAGMPFSSELPCGWGVRFSACPVYDADMVCTEFGIDPTPGGEVDMDPADEAAGKDTILDFAIDVIKRIAEEQKEQQEQQKPAEVKKYLSANAKGI